MATQSDTFPIAYLLYILTEPHKSVICDTIVEPHSSQLSLYFIFVTVPKRLKKDAKSCTNFPSKHTYDTPTLMNRGQNVITIIYKQTANRQIEQIQLYNAIYSIFYMTLFKSLRFLSLLTIH